MNLCMLMSGLTRSTAKLHSFFKPNLYRYCGNFSQNKLDKNTILLLERLSLVNFEDDKHIEILEEAITFADKITNIDTVNIEPLVSVLENRCLKLRNDEVTDGDCKFEVIRNAPTIEEDYFASPIGNVPFDTFDNLENTNNTNNESNRKLCCKNLMCSKFMIKLLEILKQYSYIKPFLSECNTHVEFLNLGPGGEFMRQNILNEWMYSNVISRDEPVFPFTYLKDNTSPLAELKQQFEMVNSLCNCSLPFSIVNIHSVNTKDTGSSDIKDNMYFRPRKRTQLRYTAFIHPSDGQRFFYYWQRQRKAWWRKFSADPGRFSSTEIENNGDGTESTHIQVEFPWGTERVETIYNVGQKYFEQLSEEENKTFEIKVDKKSVLPHIIEASTSLESTLMAFLCDAFYDEPLMNSDRKRCVMRLHRKLAPYKTALSAPIINDAKVNDDVHLLCEFLKQNLRKAGISTYSSPFVIQKSLDDQFLFNDMLGVPYTIVVTESTLSDGICGFRSRETTLQEKLHVSKLTSYLEQIMKTY